MIATEPDVSATGRYSIGEAAKLLGLCRDTLRKHSDAGLIKYGIHRSNMRKFYLGSEILRYWRASY